MPVFKALKSAVAAAAVIAPLFAATATTTSLVSSPDPSTYGEPVLLTATVGPSAATGKVTFYDGTTVLGTAPLSGRQRTHQHNPASGRGPRTPGVLLG